MDILCKFTSFILSLIWKTMLTSAFRINWFYSKTKQLLILGKMCVGRSSGCD